jgi:Arc/MetJ-type ribon-helix-helix transcriptional regulator
MVSLPPTLLQEIDNLVVTGTFPTRDAAVAELVRLGLDAMKSRQRAPPIPRPPTPPGVADPMDDAPISVDPARDIKWMG